MATLSPLSVALGFLLRSGAYCKLASSYLRLPAKCITDLTPCQAHPSWNQLHAQLRLKLHFSDAGLPQVCFKILSETCMIHNNNFLWHIFNIPESIEFLERRHT